MYHHDNPALQRRVERGVHGWTLAVSWTDPARPALRLPGALLAPDGRVVIDLGAYQRTDLDPGEARSYLRGLQAALAQAEAWE